MPNLCNKYIYLLIFSLFSSVFVNAQCDDGILNGNELRIDCGGPDCADCLPILFDVECQDGETGNFDLYLILPTWMWPEDLFEQGLYYEYEGDFSSNGEPCLSYAECGGTLSFAEGAQVDIRYLKKSLPDGDLVAFGQVNVNPDCLKADTTVLECHPDTNFIVNATKIEMSDGYMLKLEMLGGTPPYNIIDSDQNLFYSYYNPDSVYYLGLVPNDVELNIAVSDNNNCIFEVQDIVSCVNDWNIVEMNTGRDCEGFDAETGGFVVQPVEGGCDYLLSFNGEVNDTISGLKAGDYSFYAVNTGTNDSTLVQGSIALLEEEFLPLTVELIGTNPGSCGGTNSGRIEAILDGGLGPFSYTWSHCGEACGEMSMVENLGAGDYELVVTDLSNGCDFTSTANLSLDSEFSERFDLSPTVHSINTNLQFCLEEDAVVSIGVYKMNGQFLGYIVHNENYSAGAQSIDVDTAGFPVGIYAYVMESSTLEEKIVIRGLKF